MTCLHVSEILGKEGEWLQPIVRKQLLQRLKQLHRVSLALNESVERKIVLLNFFYEIS